MGIDRKQKIAYKPGLDMSKLILALPRQQRMDISGGKYRESAVM